MPKILQNLQETPSRPVYIGHQVVDTLAGAELLELFFFHFIVAVLAKDLEESLARFGTQVPNVFRRLVET